MGNQPNSDPERRWIEQVFEPMDRVLGLLNDIYAVSMASQDDRERGPEEVVAMIGGHIQHITLRLAYCLTGNPLTLEEDEDLWHREVAPFVFKLVDDINDEAKTGEKGSE